MYASVVVTIVSLLTSKLFGFSDVIHFTPVSCNVLRPKLLLVTHFDFTIIGLLTDWPLTLKTFSAMPAHRGEYWCQVSLKSNH